MRTWLFVWNPERFDWEDPYDGWEEMMQQIEQVGISVATWSCGVNKSIRSGDRIYLIRLGKEPRGIVASGSALSSPFEGPHWDDEERLKGKKVRRVFINFDIIRNPTSDGILTLELLKIEFPNYHWSSQSSGVSIPDCIAAKLEILWS